MTCHFGIDTNFWHPNESMKKDSYIMSVGNDMNRDFNTLVKALPQGQKLKLVTSKKIENFGKNIQILNNWITDEELLNIYQKAIMVIIPSIKLKSESSGLSTTLQSMACKCIVIIPKLPPLMELFEEGVDCIYYEVENSLDLRKKINYVLHNKELCLAIAENGYNKVIQNYTVNHMGRKLSKILART